MNIRFKITVLFALVVMALLSLLSFVVYYSSALERENAFKTRLSGRANNIVQLFLLFGDSSTTVLKRLDSTSATLPPNKHIAIYDQNDQPVYENESGTMTALKVDKNFLTLVRADSERYIHSRKIDIYAGYYQHATHGLVIR